MSEKMEACDFNEYGLQLGMTVAELACRSSIVPRFINEIGRIVQTEQQLRGRKLARVSRVQLREADRQLEELRLILLHEMFKCGGLHEPDEKTGLERLMERHLRLQFALN